MNVSDPKLFWTRMLLWACSVSVSMYCLVFVWAGHVLIASRLVREAESMNLATRATLGILVLLSLSILFIPQLMLAGSRRAVISALVLILMSTPVVIALPI